MGELRTWKFEEIKSSIPSVIRSFRSWEVIHHDNGGYTDNEVEFNIYKDGMICIDGKRDFTFLYPAQIEHLKFVLAELAKLEEEKK